MSGMAVNGAAILSAIARNPTELSFEESQVNDLAMNALLSKLKDKVLKIEHLRNIAAVIGKNDMKLALDHLHAKETTSLVKRLDAKNPELKSASETWIRSRASALIVEGADPSAPPPKMQKAPTPSTGSKTGKALKSKALKPRAPRKATSAKVME